MHYDKVQVEPPFEQPFIIIIIITIITVIVIIIINIIIIIINNNNNIIVIIISIINRRVTGEQVHPIPPRWAVLGSNSRKTTL